MAAPLPQPDFHKLNQAITGISEQIGRIPNMPAVVGTDALIANLQEQHHQALAQQAQQHAAILAQQAQHHRELIDRLDALQEGQRRLPMQLKNATAPLEAPLQYPPNVVIGDQFPRTKQDLLRLTAADAQVVSQALGLPALPANSSVAARQQQIIDFLGCCIRA